jgi:hypothetical protein
VCFLWLIPLLRRTPNSWLPGAGLAGVPRYTLTCIPQRRISEDQQGAIDELHHCIIEAIDLRAKLYGTVLLPCSFVVLCFHSFSEANRNLM